MSPEGYLKPSKLGEGVSLRPLLLPSLWVDRDRSFHRPPCEHVLPVVAGTELVRDVSCPGLHPTVDRPAGWPVALQTGLEPTPVFDEA